MQSGTPKISDIFNRSRILEIPHFQRSYVWNEEQWIRFLEDMQYVSKSKEQYFLGSVILKQQETSSLYQTGDVRTIVDGQQRLTTITLFFKALYTKNKTPELFNTVFKTFTNELIITHNYSDKEIFEKILLDDNDITEENKQNKIYQCYEFFLNKINKNEIDPNIILGNVTFVGIDLNSKEDEQLIFDTINSLGVSLTTAELMKNYLFNRDLDSYIENWRNIFEKDNDIKQYWEQEITSGRNKRTNIDLFLESFLLIKIQQKDLNVKTEDKLRYFKIDSLFNSYKEFIKKYKISRSSIIQEIKEYAKIYKTIISPTILEEDIDKDNYIQRLNLIMFALDTATIIPYVLYLSKNISDSEEKNEIFKYIETYLMRRLLVKATTKNYNQLFRQSLINKEINSLNKLQEIIGEKSDKLNFMPNDNNVKKGISESWLTNKQARGILYLIEKTIRSSLNSTELKYINEYSLEHIMPKKWRNHWEISETFTEMDKNNRDRLILTLGNLTIITKKLNSSISDSSWSNKKIGKGNKKGLNEYANGIEIFSKYLENEIWDESIINKRGNELYEYCINSVWKLS